MPVSEEAGPAPASAQVARSAGGVVASAHPLATQAGLSMLERGGNAVDAAVASAFALAVVEPSMSGIGGRAQILIRTADGEVHGIDATTQAPSTYDPATAARASYGYGTVGIPGVVAGLTTALERFGSLSLMEVMTPAIELAREGFELLPREALRHAAARERLSEFEGSRAYFLKEDGSTYAAGERLVQEDLARTLEAIAAEGAEVFYRGWIAERMAEDLAAHEGHLTLQSLADYRAEESRIVRGSYRGYELAGLWVPSYGALTIEMLQVLETLPLGEIHGAEWAAAMAEGLRMAFQDTYSQESWADAERLTSKEWARERAAEMRLAGPSTASTSDPGEAISPPEWLQGHTTHLTTADGEGNVVALTQSLGPALGAKVATPGLGFLYAVTLGGYISNLGANGRAASNISPLLVLSGGEPFLGLGAAGGRRIPPAVVAVVSRIIDHGMSLEEALAAPRVYPLQEGFEVEIGTGLGFMPEDLEAMRSMGLEVEVVDREGAFGRVHAVLWDEEAGAWIGAADPDWEGSAAGLTAGGGS